MMYRKSDPESAVKTAECLKNGGIVIIPTDTVYGFSGIVPENDREQSFNTDDRIRKIKGRAETKPFIQLIARPDDICRYTDEVIPARLLSLWPGALTIIVRNKDGSGTTAFRCPGDEWLRSVIAACGRRIYSTSVNRSGSPVLDTIAAIEREFSAETDSIVDDGDKKNALPSTIIKLEQGSPVVIRQGTVKIK